MRSLVYRHACALALLLSVARPVFAQDSTQVAKGREVYTQYCALCHGVDGKKGEGYQTPIWGSGSFIASKFGNAQALIDYMQIMPFNDPSLINDEQRIAVVAYMLVHHGALQRDGQITPQNASTLPIK
jgi:mono/diheme cytochrome c family protein